MPTNYIDSIRLSGVTYTLSAETSGGNNVVELTQAQYDALVTGGTVDPNTFYIITDATPINMANYYTTAQTDTAISQATSGKQDTITAGRGISIDSANTISLNVPISAGTGTNSIKENRSSNDASGSYSHSEGFNTFASGNWGSHAEGQGTTAKGYASHSEGSNTNAYNNFEHASGVYNLSNSATTIFGDSGNTLFSVGNGTSNNARHNAFEIRQNGDIYLSLNGQDVKLQDQLGGGSITIDPSLDSGSTNAVANSAITTAIEAVSGAIPTTTSAVTSGSTDVVESGAVYDQLGGLKLVKLTQSAYDALSPNYDSNTLYVIVN